MWLIKLPFRILAIPVFLVAFLILIVIKLLSYLGNLAGGLVILIVAGGLFSIFAKCSGRICSCRFWSESWFWLRCFAPQSLR